MNIVVGLLRIKAAAVLLGPAGVGLIGLMTSLVSTASTLAGLGFGTAGTRQIAEASAANDARAVATARRALFIGTLVLCSVGAAAIWGGRTELASILLGDASRSGQVGWLAIGVALSVAAASQTAVLTGLRRTADIACVSVASALIGTAVAVAGLFSWGDAGVVIFVLAMPFGSALAGYFYVARLPRAVSHAIELKDLYAQWRSLAALGVAFMAGGLITTLGQLTVRSLVQRELGLETLGYFQAAATLSMTYLGFVLAAMGADYYPRLTACIKDPDAANRLINEQAELALLLAAPVLLTTMGLAPWVIKLLYAESFHPASDVLRWYVLGDVLKVASWPLGFALLASGSGRMFILTEAVGMGTFVLLALIGLPIMGISSTGIAYACMYLIYFSAAYLVVRKTMDFRFSSRFKSYLVALTGCSVAFLVLVKWYPTVTALAGVATAGCWGMFAVQRLATEQHIGGSIGRAATWLVRRIKSDSRS